MGKPKTTVRRNPLPEESIYSKPPPLRSSGVGSKAQVLHMKRVTGISGDIKRGKIAAGKLTPADVETLKRNFMDLDSLNITTATRAAKVFAKIAKKHKVTSGDLEIALWVKSEGKLKAEGLQKERRHRPERRVRPGSPAEERRERQRRIP